MAVFDEKQFKRHIQSKEFFSSYLVCGEESYLKQFYTGKLASAAVDPAFESFNLERFDGKGLALKDVFERASIMPMMCKKRVMIVNDYKLEPLSEKDNKLLSAQLPLLPESSIVIFKQDENPVTKKGGKKIFALFDKYGAVCELNKRSGNDLIKPLISSAAKSNCTLSTATAQYLVACVGNDFNILMNELSKVCNYVGQGEITKQHIDAVAVKSVDAKVSQIIRAIVANRFDAAYETLDSLIRQKVEPGYIIGSIIGTYVDLYRAKVALTCSGKTQPILDSFQYKGREFSMNYAARDCSKIEIDKLRKCLCELEKADLKLKNGENGVLIIEQLIVKLSLISNGENVC